MYTALATRPDVSASNLQPIFDYISTAMASVSASAIVSQGTRIPIGPMTARTANLREAMCFSPVMELSRGSLESGASSPCQLSRPSSSPTRRALRSAQMPNSQPLLCTHGRKCGRYTHESNGFVVIGGQFMVKVKVVSLVFWNIDFFVYIDGHPQATVVLFPCSLLKQGFKEATMENISCASSLFV
jgi:hypothetical protein